MPIANYSTTVSVDKTVGEIQTMLGKSGAKGVLIEFNERRIPSAVRFSFTVGERELFFALPARSENVLAVFRKQNVPKKLRCIEQAERTAWRQIKDWVRAQAAFVEAEQVELSEIFLPFMLNQKGETLFEVMKGVQFALPNGDSQHK